MTPLEIYTYFVIPFGGAAACLGFIIYTARRKRARMRADATQAAAFMGGDNFPRMAVDNTTSAA